MYKRFRRARSVIPYQMVTSIVQNGITFTFDSPTPAAQTVDGEWVVQTPFTVDVSPGWQNLGTNHNRNGAMLDPGVSNYQGFYQYDSGGLIFAYNASVRAQFPLTITNDGQIHSLVATIGKSVPQAGGAQSFLDDLAILTAVPLIPANVSRLFRPAYMGTREWPSWDTVESRLSLLPKLALPNGASYSSLAALKMERTWFHTTRNNYPEPGTSAGSVHPSNNMPTYYHATSTAEALLVCCLDDPAVPNYVKRLVRWGLDLFGCVNTLRTDMWTGLGGYGSGFKAPIIFAGHMLNRADMTTGLPSAITGKWSNVVRFFGEDAHTYYSSAYSPARAMFGQNGAAQGYTEPYFSNHDFRSPYGLQEPEAPTGYPGFTATAWTTGTSYSAGAFVSSGGKVYKRDATPTGGVSGATAPTGTGTSSDGNFSWTFQGNTANNNGAYRKQNLHEVFVREMLALWLMGLKSTWDSSLTRDGFDSAIWDYVARYIADEVASSDAERYGSAFSKAMWTTYGGSFPA